MRNVSFSEERRVLRETSARLLRASQTTSQLTHVTKFRGGRRRGPWICPDERNTLNHPPNVASVRLGVRVHERAVYGRSELSDGVLGPSCVVNSAVRGGGEGPGAMKQYRIFSILGICELTRISPYETA